MNKYKVNILPFAECEIYDIVSYHFNYNQDFSRKLYFNTKDRIQELEIFPERGMLVPELEKHGFLKYRQLLESNYRIIYSIQDKFVFIHLVVDSRRNLEEILIKRLQ